MAKALVNYTKYRDAVDAARINNTSVLEEYQKLGGKIFEGTNKEVADYPKAFAIYDEEKAAKKVKAVKKLGKAKNKKK